MEVAAAMEAEGSAEWMPGPALLQSLQLNYLMAAELDRSLPMRAPLEERRRRMLLLSNIRILYNPLRIKALHTKIMMKQKCSLNI